MRYSSHLRNQELPHQVFSQGAYIVDSVVGTPRSQRITRFEDVTKVNQHDPSSRKTPEAPYFSSRIVIAPEVPGL